MTTQQILRDCKSSSLERASDNFCIKKGGIAKKAFQFCESEHCKVYDCIDQHDMHESAGGLEEP